MAAIGPTLASRSAPLTSPIVGAKLPPTRTCFEALMTQSRQGLAALPGDWQPPEVLNRAEADGCAHDVLRQPNPVSSIRIWCASFVKFRGK